jgi:hypothetical protein
MNDAVIVNEIINQINRLEKEFSKNKYSTNNNLKKDIVNLIINELERLTSDEN